jgi:uncharacterized protein (DUF58 family)
MRGRSEAAAVSSPLINWTELKDIELVVLKRMHEYAAGAHPSVLQGLGLDFVGLRDWQAGDRLADIDWAQSTLTNFSPLVSREFEQNTTVSMMIVADTSPSIRCGIEGVSIAKVVARGVATLSMAGTFFQDKIGLVTLNGQSRRLAIRPKVGKNHALHCIETYESHALEEPAQGSNVRDNLAGMLRRPSLVPVVSDFLFEDAETLIKELGRLGAVHDVFLVMVDCAFAYAFPTLSAGWVEANDVETGQTRLLSARELDQLVLDVRLWQDTVVDFADKEGLELVRIEPGHEHEALSDFLGQRRLRKR